MGSLKGVLKIAAKKIGISFAEYQDRVSSGKKWCTICREWHDISEFGIDNTRHDGLTPSCSSSRNRRMREKHVPKPFVDRRGRKFTAARDGDKSQARGRVNHLVSVGVLADPNSIPCVDCGHMSSDRRHEYDHYKGYAARHHETVEAVCSICHKARHSTARRRDGRGRYK